MNLQPSSPQRRSYGGTNLKSRIGLPTSVSQFDADHVLTAPVRRVSIEDKDTIKNAVNNFSPASCSIEVSSCSSLKTSISSSTPSCVPTSADVGSLKKTLMCRRGLRRSNSPTGLNVQNRTPRKPDIHLSPKTNRKVKFRTNLNGRIDTTIIPSNLVLDCDDIRKGWMSRKEMKQSRSRATETCKFFLRERRRTFEQASIKLLKLCGAQRIESEYKPGQLYHEDESSEHENINRCAKNLTPEVDGQVVTARANAIDGHIDCVTVIVDSESRGLEKRLINALNLPYHRHVRSVQSALDTQQRLDDMEPGFFTIEQRTRLIASQYGLNTKYASVWAQVVAEADSKLAAKYYGLQNIGHNCIGSFSINDMISL